MASIPIDERTSPHPLPSLPPSPTTSEDLSRAHVWSEQDDDDDEKIPQKKDKGKSKEVINLNIGEGGSGESSEEEGGGSYPPTSEDAAETRRIEDNLRKWEMAERQRRKAARESTQAPSRSLVADVTRRASLLWPGKTRDASRPSRKERKGLGNHTALASVDSVDVVPMDDIEGSPTLSANTSPATSPNATKHPTNPFRHPTDSLSSLHDSHEQQTAVMDGSSNPPTPSEKGKGTSQPERPTLMASTSPFKKQPPPKPLGLPPPRTPPPPNTPNASSPPRQITSPTLADAPQEQEEPKETRWWHDWLCGLTEGSDRGGDDQAGRTNPFE